MYLLGVEIIITKRANKIKKNTQTVKNNVGERIREIRKNANQSQKAFGKALDVTPATVNRYEMNHRSPDSDFLNKLVAKYPCDPTWLLTGFEQIEKEPVLNVAGLETLDPEMRMIVAWFAEAPETKALFVRFIRTCQELNSIVDELKLTGTRSLRKITS